MSFKNKKYLLHKLKQQQQANRTKQQQYNTRFSITQKNKSYNALEDPHASYYFVSQSVRNHLKNIKNATINETTNSLERQRLKNLYNQKIRIKQPSMFFKKSGINQLQQILTNEALRRNSVQTMHSQRNRTPRKVNQRSNEQNLLYSSHEKGMRRRKFATVSQQLEKPSKIVQQPQTQRNDEFREKESGQIKGIPIRSNYSQAEKRQRKTRYEKLHDKRHKKFLSFIEEKKKFLLDFQQNFQNQNKQV